MISLNTPSSNNSFYVNRNITSWYQDGSLWDRINGKNGYVTMEGIYPGCWFYMNNAINSKEVGNTSTGGRMVLIIGCNSLYNQGEDSLRVTYDHIVCCPYNHFGLAKMNLTDISTGGYWNSHLQQDIIGSVTSSPDVGGTINQQLLNEFGSHLKTYSDIISSSIDDTLENSIHIETGASSAETWHDIQAQLMSEVEVYGSTVFSSSAFDIGCAKTQFPAFKNNTGMVNFKQGYWLKDVVSKTRFACLNHKGDAYYRKATDMVNVRPKWILS